MEHSFKSNPVTFQGKGGEFFGIWIVNLLLSVITLGIYSAWAKVRTNRYFYGNTFIAGDNFEYHATPIQILKGRIIAFVLVVIWTVVASVSPVFSALLAIIFYLLLPWLLRSNARFDCAMTSYRNVHFSFMGSLADAYKAMLGRGLVALVVLAGYAYLIQVIAQHNAGVAAFLSIFMIVLVVVMQSWVLVGMKNYFINGYRYGDWQFSGELELRFFIMLSLKVIGMFIGLGIVISSVFFFFFDGLSTFSDMSNPYGNWLAVILGAAASLSFMVISMTVLAIVSFAYMVVQTRNYIFSRIVVSKEGEESRFGLKSTLTTGGYAGLTVSNFFILVFTLGLGRAWVMVRTAKYLADFSAVEGDMTLLIAADQDSDVKSSVGDEVAQAFDVGVGLG